MDFNIEIIGLIAGAFTTASFVPQVIKTWKAKSADNLSLSMYLVMLTGVILWLIYGIYLESISMILANTVTTILVCAILFFKFRYKK
ncbi:MAG: MtN3 and saliva related transmembrane protein [Candidatus Azotimanducaceae bacterium]|jgi:MtN3 and saliva related transmembrane protein